jgi:hypothetical protein
VTRSGWDRDRLLALCPDNPGYRPGSSGATRWRAGRVRSAAGELTVVRTHGGRHGTLVFAVNAVCGLTADACCRLLDLVRATEVTATGG